MKGRARSENYNDVFTRHHVDMGNLSSTIDVVTMLSS